MVEVPVAEELYSIINNSYCNLRAKDFSSMGGFHCARIRAEYVPLGILQKRSYIKCFSISAFSILWAPLQPNGQVRYTETPPSVSPPNNKPASSPTNYLPDHPPQPCVTPAATSSNAKAKQPQHPTPTATQTTTPSTNHQQHPSPTTPTTTPIATPTSIPTTSHHPLLIPNPSQPNPTQRDVRLTPQTQNHHPLGGLHSTRASTNAVTRSNTDASLPSEWELAFPHILIGSGHQAGLPHQFCNLLFFLASGQQTASSSKRQQRSSIDISPRLSPIATVVVGRNFQKDFHTQPIPGLAAWPQRALRWHTNKLVYLLGLLAKIKCSICSYQLNF